jgi:hypothetical protein
LQKICGLGAEQKAAANRIDDKKSYYTNPSPTQDDEDLLSLIEFDRGYCVFSTVVFPIESGAGRFG